MERANRVLARVRRADRTNHRIRGSFPAIVRAATGNPGKEWSSHPCSTDTVRDRQSHHDKTARGGNDKIPHQTPPLIVSRSPESCRRTSQMNTAVCSKERVLPLNVVVRGP